MDLIIFALIAVYFMYKLNNALGNKDYNYEEHKSKIIVDFPETINNYPRKEKIIDAKIEISDEEAISNTNPEIIKVIKDIRGFDKEFVEKSFLKSAAAVFEMILTAFSKGDLETLKILLSEKLYKEFLHHIDLRNKNQLTMERSIISIKVNEIIRAKLENNIAILTVKFVTEQIFNVKNNKGEVIEGDPNFIENKVDLWSFKRNLKNNSPNWELSYTE